jgi:pimeloyl-ACP methyl ester carboxylesterase
MKRMPEDRYTTVLDIRTRYWQSGTAGDAVILIHGLGGCIENWMMNIDVLGERYRVFACDLVGFGRSEKKKVPFTHEFVARFIAEFMKAVGVGRAHLIGNSLGGGIALQVALEYPALVDKLVLVNTGGFGREVTYLFKLTSIPILGDILSKPSRGNTRRTLKECVFDPELITDEVVEMYAEMESLPGAHESLLFTLRTVINVRGVKEEIYRPIFDGAPGLAASTLIVWGEEDRIIPVKHAYVAHERIPHSRLHIYKRCGHLPQFEEPQEFNQLVMAFLEE